MPNQNQNQDKKQYKNQDIRLRFAPSPTGYLHIGSARTAFFNWLYAKKTGGKFILRIEDTDIKRHKEDTIDTIIDSLKWLGLNWDEGPYAGGNYGPYRQSERQDIYIKYAYKLLDEGKAYYCFCSAEELQKKREEALKNGVFFNYDKKCLNLSDEQIQKKISANGKFSIRILVPENKIISFDDNVYGHIEVNSNIIEDFIILRSDKTPTYNFSVAIDDYLMNITHVIRGEDHLSNTPKQLLIYDSLGFDYPDFTHLPMILSADGQKLSKRHGSVSIESYREEGFLPEAVLNYIALLGWAYDEKTTFFTVNEMIEKFDLKSVNKKTSRFDYDKLLFINSYYIRNKDNKELKKILTERLLKNNLQYFREYNNKNFGIQDIDEKLIAEMLTQKIAKILPIIKERAKTLNEMQNKIMPFFFDIKYEDNIKNYFKDKETNATTDNNAISILKICISELNKIEDNNFNSEKIETEIRNIADQVQTNLRKIAEVIRIAIWGELVSPPLFETIEILGKKVTLSRLENYLDLILP